MKLSKAEYAALEAIVTKLDTIYGIVQDLSYLEVPYDKEKVQDIINSKDKLSSDPSKLADFINQAAEPIAYLEEIANKTFSNLSAYQRFKLSRHPARPKTSDYIRAIFDDFTELVGEKDTSPDPSVIGGIARLGNRKFVIMGQEKGILGEDAHYREGGVMKPAGYRKSQRLMEIAEQLNLPLITFIDTPGANPIKETLSGNVSISIDGKRTLVGDEDKEVEIQVNESPYKIKIKVDDLVTDIQAQEISKSIRKMGQLTVPIISVVVGEGGSGGAVGIGAADKMLMLSNSYFSVISPEGACGILKKTNEKGERVKLDPSNKDDLEYAAKNLRFSAKDCLEFKIADEVIEEPLYGVHSNPKLVYEEVKESILRNLNLLEEKSFKNKKEVIQRRLEKYRQVERFSEGKPQKQQKFSKRFKNWVSEETKKWESCPNNQEKNCKDMHPRTLFHKYQGVCPNCDYHFRMPLEFYIENILDKNSFEEFDYTIESINAIGFEGSEKLLEEARKKAGTGSALISGKAKIGGKEIIAILTQNDFRGGSFASAESEKIVRAVKKAVEYKSAGKIVPVIMFNKGGGIRLEEGPIGVAQMITSSQACSLLKEEGIPLISVLLDPTMAGILASYAGNADFVIAEKNAMIGFAGEDVIKKTIGEEIKKEFRFAEEAEKRGVLDLVAHRHNLKKTLEKIISLY
ncbi:hypothetical protein HZA33_00205 [Candidatus Pacearchaeota archaeon]|nr:hypothetical protein [Candidatus Pacearchaeota archaeon]